MPILSRVYYHLSSDHGQPYRYSGRFIYIVVHEYRLLHYAIVGYPN